MKWPMRGLRELCVRISCLALAVAAASCSSLPVIVPDMASPRTPVKLEGT